MSFYELPDSFQHEVYKVLFKEVINEMNNEFTNYWFFVKKNVYIIDDYIDTIRKLPYPEDDWDEIALEAYQDSYNTDDIDEDKFLEFLEQREYLYMGKYLKLTNWTFPKEECNYWIWL